MFSRALVWSVFRFCLIPTTSLIKHEKKIVLMVILKNPHVSLLKVAQLRLSISNMCWDVNTQSGTTFKVLPFILHFDPSSTHSCVCKTLPVLLVSCSVVDGKEWQLESSHVDWHHAQMLGNLQKTLVSIDVRGNSLWTHCTASVMQPVLKKKWSHLFKCYSSQW